MAMFDFLVETNSRSEWSDTTLMLLMILFSLGITLTIALSAPQDFRQLIPIAIFSFMTVMVVVGIIAKNVTKPPLLNVQGLNTPLWAGISAFVGFVLYGFIYLTLVYLHPTSVNPGNVLPLGSIYPSVPEFELLQKGVFAPFLETMFFVAFLYPTTIALLKRFEATRRIMYYPVVGVFITALVVAFGIAFLFTCHHLLVYSQLNVNSPDFFLTFAQNLFTIDMLCLFWIISMQVTRSVVAPLMMHFIQNWFALIDTIKAAGGTLTIIDFFIYIIIPILIIYGLATFVSVVLPKPRRVVM